MAVEIKTFVEGFEDLERLYETRTRLHQAMMKVRRVLVDTSLGSLDDRSILTEEERTKFFNLSNAMNKAYDLLTDKIIDQEKKCIRMNVTGFSNDPEGSKQEDEEENEYF